MGVDLLRYLNIAKSILFKKNPTFLAGVKSDLRASLIPNYPAFVAEDKSIPDLPPIQDVARKMNAPVAGIDTPKKGQSD